MNKWNGKRFSIYDNEEKQMLGLVKNLGDQTNYNTDEVERLTISDNKKVSHEEMHNTYKVDENANFTGSWFGIKRPTASNEGMSATLELIKNETIPQIKEELNTKATQSEVQEVRNRVDNISGNGTATEGNSELLDGRMGNNGTSFGSIGNHIRSVENGNIKNIDTLSFSAKAFENEILEQITIKATSGTFSEMIHASCSVSIPLTVGVNKVNCYIEYESNSPYITSVEQRTDIGGQVKKGTTTKNTVGSLTEDMVYSTTQTGNNMNVYFWVTCSETAKSVTYKIKKWIITINDTITYDLINKIDNGFSLNLPFNVTGSKTKNIIKKNALTSKKEINFLKNYKNYLLGNGDFNFTNGKNVSVTKPYETGGSIFGFAKTNIPLDPVKDIINVRVKGKFLSFHNVYDFTTLLEIVDNNNVMTTISGERYYPKQGDIYNFDYTYNLTEKNLNIKNVGIYLRANVLENVPFNYDFGNIEIYINGELTPIYSWYNAFSQATISDIETISKNTDISNIMSIVSPLKGKNIKFFGDSIMDTYSQTKRTPYWVCNLTGANQYNYAVSSSGLSMDAVYNHDKWGASNTNVPSMIERSISDGITPDYVVVAGGTNDWDFQKKPFGTFADAIKDTPTIDTFYGSIGLTIRKLLKHYPLSKILFVTPLPRKQTSGSGSQHTVKPNGKTVIDYSKAIIEVCNYFSINSLHLTENSGFNLESDIALQTFMSDGLHPTERGAKERHAPRIIKALEEM